MSFQPLSSRSAKASIDAPTLPHPPRVLAATALDARRSILLLLAVFFAATFLAIFATRASGQAQYESITMHEYFNDEAAVKGVQTVAKRYVTTGNGNPNSLKGYFEFYVPAKITEIPDGLKNITALVKETDTLLTRAHRSNRPRRS